jgi:LPPG:FO 2-phospho-L-lactate transferase
VAERVAVLCGGLGGSRLVHSLALAAGPASVTAIGNVGDDIEFLGLHVSPDLDTVLYTLTGLLDEERGWGVREETYAALGQAERLGEETWFTLGDRDIGLHLVRTLRLGRGQPLSAVMQSIAQALEAGVVLLPATDDRVRTFVDTDAGQLDFQTWYVRRRHEDVVRHVHYEGAEEARPAPGVVEALSGADVVLIAPSNPFVSIAPILAVPGIPDAVRECAGPRVAVSPLIRGQAVRGPLAGMMESLGHEPTAVGIARMYGTLIDTFVLDQADAELAPQIEKLGLRAVVRDTVMVDPSRRQEVGRQVLEAVLTR